MRGLASILIIIGLLIFLFLWIAVEDDKRWFNKFCKENQGPDSIRMKDTVHYFKQK